MNKMCLIVKSLLITTILAYVASNTALAQRSFLHWKNDLSHQISAYTQSRETIEEIIRSSIYTPQQQRPLIAGPIHLLSSGNVRFSDLIVPMGSLVLESHLARPTVRILADRTANYVNAKRSDLSDINHQLDQIVQQLNDPRHQFIYKGLPSDSYLSQQQLPHNYTNLITGTRVFKQAQYAGMVDVRQAHVQQINYTNVDKVINATYLRNAPFGVYDSQDRLFFEGRKTFWNTVFSRPLRSGCCGRLRPLDTNRVMLRSAVQEVIAPVLIHSAAPSNLRARSQQPPVAVIRRLTTNQLSNRDLSLAPDLSASQADNIIQLANLVRTRQLGQPELLKTIVFKNYLNVQEAQLASSPVDNRLGIGLASQPNFWFDLTHDNYLLRFHIGNLTTGNQREQFVSGSMIVESVAQFVRGLDGNSVNGVSDFRSFVRDQLVRLDRTGVPQQIRGPVYFNALPALLNPRPGPTSRLPQSVPIIQVANSLQVGQINGMRLPQDVVVLPVANSSYQQAVNGRLALKPYEVVHVRGPRHFVNGLRCESLLQVNERVNGLQLPNDVIPLHLNDFMHSVGYSNLWFMDGISVHHLITQSGQFDDIVLRDVHGDAPNLIMRSAVESQSDGTRVIRAPLRVVNLRVINPLDSLQGQQQQQQQQARVGGLLNGFRPQEILELARNGHRYDTLAGRKTFASHVEAIDCMFNDINELTNWTSHLIRIDRPNTVQTVHTKLSFSGPPQQQQQQQQSSGNVTAPPTSGGVFVNRFNVDFYPDNNPINYANNWQFSPEFYTLHQALVRTIANRTGGRYRVLDRINVIPPNGGRPLVNNIPLEDIVTLDEPFKFVDRFVMVGKVEVMNSLSAGRINSNYPIDAMDLIQFDKYRIPISGSRTPISLNNLVLGTNNRASFVQCRMINGISFDEFARSIMSLTRPQVVDSHLVFNSAVSFEGMVRTESALNGVKNFNQFARTLKNANYLFEDGLQCNTVVIKS